MNLPTEAEWEYGARGLESWLYPWGDDFDGRKVNFCDMSCGLQGKDTSYDDGYQPPAPIGTYEDGVSWVGAFDMSGNVSEWILSIYDPIQYPYPYADDGRNALTDEWRILRGGSWRSSLILVRAAHRGYAVPDDYYVDMGFRVILHSLP
jgi:formylglycine-generating enzyme required for sulfatase activity